MKNYLLDRAREASTWRGLILIATAVGIPVAPDLGEYIVSAGIGVAGLIGVLTADK
jgi:hypothetical protein